MPRPVITTRRLLLIHYLPINTINAFNEGAIQSTVFYSEIQAVQGQQVRRYATEIKVHDHVRMICRLFSLPTYKRFMEIQET
jgi:hypothetical protein